MLLMTLRNVPDDEADDVRAMLEAQQIEKKYQGRMALTCASWMSITPQFFARPQKGSELVRSGFVFCSSGLKLRVPIYSQKIWTLSPLSVSISMWSSASAALSASPFSLPRYERSMV